MTYKITTISLGPSVDVIVHYFSTTIPAWVLGTIIDVETRGLDPEKTALTGLGIIQQNRISAFVISSKSEAIADHCTKFRNWAIGKVKRCPRPYQPAEYQKKSAAVSFSHFWASSNKTMLSAEPPAILEHLVADLFEELALYVSLSQKYRDDSFSLNRDIQTYFTQNFTQQEDPK